MDTQDVDPEFVETAIFLRALSLEILQMVPKEPPQRSQGTTIGPHVYMIYTLYNMSCTTYMVHGKYDVNKA